MRHFLVFFILISLFFGILSCDTTKATVPSGTECSTKGVVKDMTGLDGCKFLIQTEDGKLLLPVEISNSRFKLVDGDQIAFDFVQNKEVQFGICQAEDMMVNITCIRSLTNSKVDDCVDTNSPAKVKWLGDLIDKYNPQRISKYPYNNDLLYLIEAKPNSFAYDCKGKLVCEITEPKDDLCLEQVKSLGKAQIIYVGSGMND